MGLPARRVVFNAILCAHFVRGFMRIRCCAVLGGVLLTSACGGESTLVGRPDLMSVAPGQLPAPTREDIVIPARPYVIGASDQLVVDVFGAPELSKTVTVDLTGQVSLPLVGTVKVSGLTAVELEADITSRLRGAYVRDPRVTVNIAQAASQVVTVDGAVQTPGIYPLVGRMSLMRAVARASGTTEFAKEDFVVIYRQANGQKYAALYDLRAIRRGIVEDPEVFSNDLIFVGESHARRIFKDISAAAPLVTTPIIALLR